MQQTITTGGSTTEDQCKAKYPKGSEKTKVHIFGTSNIKHINTAYVAGNCLFKKQNKKKQQNTHKRRPIFFFYTTDPSEQVDAFVLHSLCNELEKKMTPDECSESMVEIVYLIESKYENSRIVVSLGLEINRKTEKTTILIKEKLFGRRRVHFCDNGNLFYRGEAQRGVLNKDGLPLSRSCICRFISSSQLLFFTFLVYPKGPLIGNK